MSEEEIVFPWDLKCETIETLHAQLEANGRDVSLQKLRDIQLKIIKERWYSNRRDLQTAEGREVTLQPRTPSKKRFVSQHESLPS